MSFSSYSSFKNLEDVKETLGISINHKTALFSEVRELEISEYLVTTLKRNLRLALAINTEKARSEMIVAPILIELLELLEYHASLFSGVDFHVDETKGLNGRCDFLLSLSEEQYYVDVPVISVIEAKNNNIGDGLAQCIATMVAALIFNEQKNNKIDAVYGAVTTGTVWQFIRLRGNTAYIDTNEYYTNKVGEILHILQQITQLGHSTE